jgi:putative ABC transport system permease protein
METFLKDLRFGARTLIRTPGFTAVAVLILGLGIGANSTIFTLVSSLFLKAPPAVADPDRLVRVNRATERTKSGSLQYPDYAYYRDNNSVFSGFAAYAFSSALNMAATARGAVQVEAEIVSGNYFQVLGVRPALGRAFLPEEDATPGSDPVAVISHGLWQRQLGGDPDVVGSEIRLNGHPFVIVGVAAEAFGGISPVDAQPDLWVPIMMQPVVFPTGGDMLHRVPGETQVWLQGLARLRDGVSVEQARADLAALAQRLAVEFPYSNEGTTVAITEHFQYRPSLRDRLVELTRVLMAAVALVLLIACANVAILLLARASVRQRELSLRLALGAGRGRVVRQLLSEGLLLATAGGAAGFIFASWSANLAAALLPVNLTVGFRPDTRVIAFTLGICLLTTLLFGLAPAWLATRVQIVESLRVSSRSTGRPLLRNGLVVAQVALAIVLASGAGLFVRSFISANSVDLGFQTENRLVVAFNLRGHDYGEEEGKALVRRALERVSALPGVLSATTARQIPFRGVWSGEFTAEGVEPPAGARYFETGFNAVGPDYFRTMGIPFVAGRPLGGSDVDGAPAVVVVNEALARMVWPGENPVGKVVERDPLHATVVGLARNANYYDLGEDPQPQMYFSVFQYYMPRINVVVHARGNPAALARSVESEIRALDSSLIISDVSTLDDVYGGTLGSYRVLAILVSFFGVLAVILAGTGLFGVLSYVVVRRTRELGIRIALGARREQVIAMVLANGLRLALVGIVSGAIAAWLGARAVSSLLFDVSPRDPLTFAVVPVVLVLAALLASFLPARRAAHVDPLEALRHE